MKQYVKAFSGLVFFALIIIAAAGFWAVSHYDVSPRFLVHKTVETSGLDLPPLDALLKPAPRYINQPLDGEIIGSHPRILLPELSEWDGEGVAPAMARRVSLHRSQGTNTKYFDPCTRKHAMGYVVCWLVTGDKEKARLATAALLKANLTPANIDTNGDRNWELALVFDLLAQFSIMAPNERAIIADKLHAYLLTSLELLDDESLSLWHGRSTMAAEAWLLALVLHGEEGVNESVARRAQGHFLQTVSALALTEAWPEGYNYWINSRAMVIALASSGFVNGTQGADSTATVLQALQRVGLWTVYATRPDNRIEALGDEGPRVDLKDETRRVIDVIAQLTKNSVFSSYSAYLAKLHGYESYYRGYRWSFMLFNDPQVQLLPGVPRGSLEGLERHLPPADIFGGGAMNLLIARQGWGSNDTFISMRAGHTFTHHGHYDAGHFTLFKGAPLAITNAKYNSFFTPHRLYYGIRTVAKNSLLVVRPGDDIRPHKLLEENINSGGQRIVMPTGSRVRSVDHWMNNINNGDHYEGGELQAYHVRPHDFAYIRADLTGAYDSARYDTQGDGGKVSAVRRELLYLMDEDRLFVRDEVEAVEAHFPKKWLLHTVNKPRVEGSQVLVGSQNAGILESKSDLATIVNGVGRLDIKRILPRDAQLRLVGGSDYQFYVEHDQAGFEVGVGSGKNFSDGAQDKPWFDNGLWRLEIIPGAARTFDEFLVALSPSLGVDRSAEVAAIALLSGKASVLSTTDHVIIFAGGARLDDIEFTWPGEQSRLLVVGVVSGDSFQLTTDNTTAAYKVEQSGLYSFPLSLKAGATVRLVQQ